MYVLGFLDYDGTRAYLTHTGNTVFASGAILFDTLEKAKAAKNLEEKETRRNLRIYSYRDADTEPEDITED